MATPAFAANVKYCSTFNTGEGFDSVIDIYQSHGACTTTCTAGKYAFAIVQGNQCWCSNYAPSDNSASCSEGCPGYPDEKCGDTMNEAFGYLALPAKPSGTKGPSSTKPTVSSTSLPSRDEPPTPTPVISISTVTTEKEGSVETVTTISTAQQTKTTKDDETTKTSSTEDGGQASTVTQSNGAITVTAKPIGQPLNSGAPSTSASSTSNKSGISGGAIAGIVIGVIAALILLIGAFLLWRRRKRAAAMDSESPHEKIAAGGAGMIGGSRRKSVIGLGSGAKSPNGTTMDGSNITPTSSAEGGEVPYDPRLDPHSLFARYDQTTGSSRMSVRSLRDDADYSRRVLRLANPDTDE